MRKEKNLWTIGFILLGLFVVLTILVKTIDVQPIGPKGSSVGFAKINKAFFDLVGSDSKSYKASEYLGYLALAIVAVSALRGLFQLIKYRSFRAVSPYILLYGLFLVVLLFFYVFFNKVVINYRPILENGVLESSYPSSHTLLAVFAYIGGAFELSCWVKNREAGIFISIICVILSVSNVVTRAMSGYHWITDIAGGLLLASALVFFYVASVLHFFKVEEK